MQNPPESRVTDETGAGRTGLERCPPPGATDVLPPPPAAARRDLRDRLTDREVSPERNLAFITAPYRPGVNFRRCLRAYPIDQPAPDSTENIWAMGPADPADR